MKVSTEKKTWRKLETSTAKDLSGRTTPGSGNKDLYKTDVISDHWMIDCKHTDAKSFSINKKFWEKYEKIAKLEDKEFSMVVELEDKKFAVIDYETFLVLDSLWRENEESNS